MALLVWVGCAFVPQAATQPAGEPTVTTNVDMVAWGDNIEGLSIKSGNTQTPVTAEAFTYSTPVTYRGPAIMEIYLDSAQPIEQPGDEQPGGAPAAVELDPAQPAENAPDNEPNALAMELMERRENNPNLVALAVIPPNSRHVTILIAPARGGTFQTYVIDDDPAKLPPGRLRIHNHSPMKIALRCNRAEPVALDRRESTIVTPIDQAVIYELAYEKDGEWNIQENNIIRVGPSTQVQLIVLRSEAGFFTSSDGSRGGFLQTVALRRQPAE